MVLRVKRVVVLQHQLQQCGRIQSVGAAAFTGVAVDAVFNAVHLFIPLIRHVLLIRRAAEQRRHPGGLGDVNIGGTGQTVAAAAAEIARQLLPVPVDDGLQLWRQLGIPLRQLQPLVQLPLVLDSPDGHHVIVLLHKGVAGLGVVQHTAGEALHGDKAHVCPLTVLHQGIVRLRGEIAERELERFKIAGVYGVSRHLRTVVRNADMADVALLPHLQRGGKGAVRVIRVRQSGRIVELKEVDVIRL